MVGVVEQFDESLLLLSEIFNWSDVKYIKRNTTSPEDSLGEIDPVVVERIRESNQYDTRLYEYVVALLDEKIKQQGERFNTDLKKFKRSQSIKEIKHRTYLAVHDISSRIIRSVRNSDT